MAYTVSNIANSVFGNKNIRLLRISTDAATQAVATGFSVVEGIVGMCPQSMTTSAINIKLNVNASGVAANGYLGVSGCATTDVFHIAVIGR